MMPPVLRGRHIDLAATGAGCANITRADSSESALVREVSEIVHSRAQYGGANLRECV